MRRFTAWKLLLDSVIYPIICLKSVCLATFMQLAILAQSPREMSQTDRILPRYFLSRVRISIRPRYFLNAKNPKTTVAARSPTGQRHRPSERRNNLNGSLYLHARWRDRPRLGAGKIQLSPPIPSATLATDAGLHPQVICTCVSLKFIQIRVTNT